MSNNICEGYPPEFIGGKTWVYGTPRCKWLLIRKDKKTSMRKLYCCCTEHINYLGADFYNVGHEIKEPHREFCNLKE